MEKYLFLDIDGVIAVMDETNQSHEWGIVDSKQKLLGKILEQTGAKIVLSSSWRKITVEETKEYMTKKGFLFSDDIIGVTIRSYHYLDKSKKIHLSIPRGVEIKQWIDANIHSENGKNFSRKKIGEDFNYVIIDDDSDMLLEQKDHYIQTDSIIGLTEDDTLKVIKILNKI